MQVPMPMQKVKQVNFQSPEELVKVLNQLIADQAAIVSVNLFDRSADNRVGWNIWTAVVVYATLNSPQEM